MRERWRKNNLNNPKELIKCKICGKTFQHVGSHVWQRHNLSAIQYRAYVGDDLYKGSVAPKLKKKMGDNALDNGTFKNLKAGIPYWFKPGDPRAGKYTRSEETMERLRHLSSLRKY